MDRYSQIISYIREQPWAIRPSYLAVMRDIIHYRNSGGELTPEEVQVSRVNIAPNQTSVIKITTDRLEEGDQVSVKAMYR